MIQANELIVGNLLNFDRFGEIRIFKIDPDHIRMCFDFNDEFNLYYKPIPITEQWLFKFGFVFDDIAEYFTEEKVYIKYYNEFGIKIDIEGRFYNGIYQQKLQYVHQLQNLYFALTQKELILNE